MAKAVKKSPAKKPATKKKPAASPALKAAQKAKAKAAKPRPAPAKPAPKKKPAPLNAGLMTEGKRPLPLLSETQAHAVRVGGVEAGAAKLSNVIRVPFRLLRENPNNYRKTYDEAAIAELAASIEQEGLLQNLVTFPADAKGAYVVNSGNRRFRALALLRKQKKIDDDYLVHIFPKKMSEAEALALAIVENLQRQDVDVLEEAEGFKHLVDLKWSTERIAEAVGLKQRTVQDRLQLATGLFKPAREALRAKKITIEQARAIVTAPVSQLQDKLLAFATRKYQPGTAEQLRAMLKNECMPRARALFDPALYKGPMIGEGKNALCADVDKFMALQMEAVAAKAGELQETWKAVKVHGPKDGYFGLWSYKKEADPEKGGVVIEVATDGKVTIHIGYVDKRATADDIFPEPEDDDEELDIYADFDGDEPESDDARVRRAAEDARKIAEAHAQTRQMGEALQSGVMARPGLAQRLAILGAISDLVIPFQSFEFSCGPSRMAVAALREALDLPDLMRAGDAGEDEEDYDLLSDPALAVEVWEKLVALSDTAANKLFAAFVIGDFVEETVTEQPRCHKFGELGIAICAAAGFDLPAALRADDLRVDDDPLARDAAVEAGELAEDEEMA
jgi:ParB family chromosome partitioning protein